MNILGILTDSIGGRLTSQSIFDGFIQNGHNVFIYDTLNPSKFSIINFDFIIGYDFSAIKFKQENNLDIPCINYFSDIIQSPASGKNWQFYYKNLLDKNNFTFCWEKELAKKENVFYLPHFVNCETYYNKNIAKKSDVMFAGRLDTDYRLNMFLYLIKTLPQYKFSWYAIEKHYNDAILRCSDEDKKYIKKSYCGFLDTEEKMANAINSTKIVFNMNSQGKTSLNYRTFQTLACETLLISDIRGDLSLFNNKIPTYKDEKELKNIISYYLENYEEYKKLTKLLSNIIKEKFNSKHAVQKILEKI